MKWILSLPSLSINDLNAHFIDTLAANKTKIKLCVQLKLTEKKNSILLFFFVKLTVVATWCKKTIKKDCLPGVV